MGLLTSLLPPIGAGTEYYGSWDASTNTPQLEDGVGQSGNFYLVSVGGTIDLGSGSITFTSGDTVIYNGAIWQKIEGGVGYTPENISNKSTSGSLGASDTLYPSQSAVKTYVDAKVSDSITDGVTTIAPSQNVVYDSLSTKLNLSGGTMTGAINGSTFVVVPSSSTCDIGSATSNNIAISGTSTITQFGTAPEGSIRKCRATGSFLITYNGTSLITKNGKNIMTKVDDCFTMISLGSGNWIMSDYSTSDGRVLAGPINAQTGTTYTFSLSDIGQTVTLNNASSITATIPTNASVAFPIGASIDILQIGAGKVTFSPAGGVTVGSLNSVYGLAGQYTGATLKKIATDTWVLVGALVY